MSAQRTQPASGRGVSNFINRINKLPNHYKLECTFTQYQYGWSKSTNIKTFKCDGDLVFYRRGREGGGGGDRSSRLTRSPESDPNARGHVRGIALLCVQMKNHHTSRREQIAMQLNQVANQFRFCRAKLHIKK